MTAARHAGLYEIGVTIVSIMTSVLQGMAGVVGIRTAEEPRFERVERIADDVEIRRYAPRLAADVTLPGDETEVRSEGFRRLARYIFGANTTHDEIAMTAPVTQSTGVPATGVPADGKRSETIEMTAPVAQEKSAEGWTIRFYMPAEYSRATLPKPDDPSITITEVPAETMAVKTFSGSIAAEAVHHEAKMLLRILKGTAWHPVGAPVAQFYDPPWTLPFLRRNEVAVRVAQ